MADQTTTQGKKPGGTGNPFPRLGDLLLTHKLITEDELREALAQQQATGRRLGEILTSSGRISPHELVEILSERLGIPKIGIEGMIADPEVVNVIPLRIAKKYQVVALFKINGRLTVAMADPLDMVAIDEIRYQTGLTVNRVIAAPADIDEAITRFYSVADYVERVIHDSANAIAATGGAGDAEETPVVRLVDVLLSEAIKQKASDMHVEPLDGGLRVRFRVDGVLHEEAEPPARLHTAIVSRIKVLSSMDVSEKRLPQDGRFAVGAGPTAVDMRVSTIPTIHGEKVVIRILGRQGHDLQLEHLGLSRTQLHLLKNEIRATEGMILISGPTSSGKTTSLYAALREITTPEKNIVTVEDPVEYALPLINQVQINEKAGLTFPACLRAFLRQNPDVIMVGEIRDGPTAQIAIRAAMTGHLVLSTIHTIDAASAPYRLVDMGAERYLVATAIRAVLAQRLVRRLCAKCAEPTTPSEILREQLGFDALAGAGSWRRAVGCQACRGTGYSGQIGIYELFAVDDTIRSMITEGSGTTQLREHLRTRPGFSDLRAQARSLVADGVTTAEEVIRVIPRRAEVWETIA
jgi:type IV pilus assembly protein PilB